MTDYTNLKRLLDACRAENVDDPREFRKAVEALFDVCTVETISALIAENERVKARLCVCRDCGGQGEVYSGHSSYQGHNQPPEPDMDVCGTCGGGGVLGPLEDFEALAAERDQLKAENEALCGKLANLNISGFADAFYTVAEKLGVTGARPVSPMQVFASEVLPALDAAIKNAARYQWLREARSGCIEVVEWIGPHATGMTGEGLDALLDAAIGKGEQS